MSRWEVMAHVPFILDILQTLILLYLLFFRRQVVKLGGVRMRNVSSYAMQSKKLAKKRGILR